MIGTFLITSMINLWEERLAWVNHIQHACTKCTEIGFFGKVNKRSLFPNHIFSEIFFFLYVENKVNLGLVWPELGLGLD